MNKHVHADLIIAWANGAKIEWERVPGSWVDLSTPSWNPYYVYRIKPEPKPDIVRYCGVLQTQGHTDLEESKRAWIEARLASEVFFEKRIFDGETGKLKYVEIVE